MNFELFNHLLFEHYKQGSFEEPYKRIINYKMKNLMKPILGRIAEDHFVVPEISERDYTTQMFQHYKDTINKFGDYFTHTNLDRETVMSYIDKITVDELIRNRTKEPKDILGRTYQPGTKAIRLLNRIQQFLPGNLGEKILGNIKLNPKDKEEHIYLSILPEDFVLAGASADTCFSDWGEHYGDFLGYIPYNYSMVAFTEDFSWRAWLFVDPETLAYTVLPGYPRENYYGQLAVRSFFDNLGYYRVIPHYFRTALYYDDIEMIEPIFDRGNFVKAEKPYMKKCLYTNKRIKNSSFFNFQGAICDECGEIGIGVEDYENGMCELCTENH